MKLQRAIFSCVSIVLLIFCFSLFPTKASLAISGSFDVDFTAITTALGEGDFQRSILSKERLVSQLTPDLFTEKNFEKIAQTLNYIGDEYFWYLYSLESGLYGENMHSPQVLEYYLNYLDKYGTLKIIQNNSFFYKYGVELQRFSKVINDIALIAEGKKTRFGFDDAIIAGATAPVVIPSTIAGTSFVATSFAVVAAPVAVVASPMILMAVPIKFGYDFLKNKDINKKISTEINQIPFFKDGSVSETWSTTLIGYRELHKKLGRYNAFISKLKQSLRQNAQFECEFINKFETYVARQEIAIKRLDGQLRSQLFDAPIRGYCLLTNIKIILAKGLLNDNEDQIQDAGISFAKTTGFIKCIKQDETAKLWFDVASRIKDELGRGKGYEELVSKSQLSPEWSELPQNMDIKWPE